MLSPLSGKRTNGYQLETELDKQQFCLELTSIQTDRQARLHSFAALSCVRLSDECACLPAALSSAHTYSTPQLGSYWFLVLHHTVCLHTIDAVSSFLHMSYHQQGWLTSFSQLYAMQGLLTSCSQPYAKQEWLTSCSQPYAMQEWLTLFTKGMFGKPGGVFQPCPGDLATVHPLCSPEQGAGDDWPHGPRAMRQAGMLAGLLPNTLPTALLHKPCTCCTKPICGSVLMLCRYGSTCLTTVACLEKVALSSDLC